MLTDSHLCISQQLLIKSYYQNGRDKDIIKAVRFFLFVRPPQHLHEDTFQIAFYLENRLFFILSSCDLET